MNDAAIVGMIALIANFLAPQIVSVEEPPKVVEASCWRVPRPIPMKSDLERGFVLLEQGLCPDAFQNSQDFFQSVFYVSFTSN